MEQTTLADAQRLMQSQYKLPRKLSSTDKYHEGFIITMGNGDKVSFEIYQKLNQSFVLVRDGNNLQYTTTLEAAQGYAEDYLDNYGITWKWGTTV